MMVPLLPPLKVALRLQPFSWHPLHPTPKLLSVASTDSLPCVSTMSITRPTWNMDTSIIPSHHRPLHLHNVLVTPNIIKNLISVRQFTRDNNCTIEFDAFGFSVKDFLTRHILLRCDSSGDLYPVTKSSNLPVAFVSTSSSTWHQRLGHPGDEVLRSLTSRHFISCNKEKSSHVCHACQLGKHVKLPFHSSDSIVTKCFDIIHSDLWTSPIYNALVKNGTLILVPRPSDVNLVRSMWLFKHKFHADVVKSATIHTVLSLDVSRQWPIHQLDVKNAFLKGDLSETVYMHQPPSFVDSRYPNHVCLLQRSLYGLKLAPRAWFQRFAGYATRAGFSPSQCDSSLFIYTQGSEVAYLLIYVDDIILTASSLVLLHQIIDSFHKEFYMTDLGALNYFLGISAVRHPTRLFLSQKKYARQLLERAHMVNCNPSRTPIDTDSKLGPDGILIQDPTLYRSLVGGLQYLTFTHLNLSYVVQQLYASATTSLVGYTDANWAGCPSTRRSTFGYCVFLGDNLLSWSAKRQHTISRSSAEVEYQSVANVVAETAWIRNLLCELHSPLLTATLVYCDNVSAVYMSVNPVQHQRTKHIEIDIHFVYDMVKDGHVRVLHVPSHFQYVDIFTKGLPSALFEDFRSSLSVRPSSAPTVGAY
ncbi:ribonuclease H-like domain-containing protein [Tanacetum coccineum]